MNIADLENMLASLKAQGLPATTPVVLCRDDGDENTERLEELSGFSVLDNAVYSIESEKMANIRLRGSVLVLTTPCAPEYMNSEEAGALGVVDSSDLYEITKTDITSVATELWERVHLDASRWTALLSAAGIRILGSSGLVDRPNVASTDYAHFGMEIWTHHTGSYDNVRNAEIITRFADKMAANLARVADMRVTLPDNLEPMRVPFRAEFVGEQTCMGLRDKALASLLDETGNITERTAKLAAVRQGICRDVKLIVDYRSDTIKLIVEDIEETDDRFVITGKFVCDGKDVEFTNEAFDAYNHFGPRDNREPNIAGLTEAARVAGLYGVVRVVPVYAKVD